MEETRSPQFFERVLRSGTLLKFGTSRRKVMFSPLKSELLKMLTREFPKSRMDEILSLKPGGILPAICPGRRQK
jgi:hypothetical protein